MDERPLPGAQTLELQDEDVGGERVPVTAWKERVAARTAIFRDGKVALMHVTKSDYYKLPGGGVEPSETLEEAAVREAREETGCEIRLGPLVGRVVEWRSHWAVKQTSACFLAEFVADGDQSLEADEAADGFEPVWLPPEEALRRIKASRNPKYQGGFMQARDSFLLKASSRMRSAPEARRGPSRGRSPGSPDS